MLVLGAKLDVGVEQGVDDLGYLLGFERGPKDFAYSRLIGLAPAKGHLEKFFAFFINPKNADVADVVVATGVHAARDVEFNGAQVVQIIQVIEAILDGLGDGN